VAQATELAFPLIARIRQLVEGPDKPEKSTTPLEPTTHASSYS
jgi:hypothetical protein